MTGAGKNLADHTRHVWQSRTRRELTDNDCREIERNVLGFWRILAEWDRSSRDEANTNVSPLANTKTIFQKKIADDSKTEVPETQYEHDRRVPRQTKDNRNRHLDSGVSS